jgi:hypothetical protein
MLVQNSNWGDDDDENSKVPRTAVYVGGILWELDERTF